MKKGTLLMLLIGIICLLTSCATITSKVEFTQDTSIIQKIDIYYVEKCYTEGDIHNFLEDNAPIYTLKEEVWETFLEMVGNLQYEKEVVFFPIPMDGGCDYQGYIISIVYSNGSYDLIAEGGLYSCLIDEKGEDWHKYDYVDYTGITDWSTLIELYIEA